MRSGRAATDASAIHNIKMPQLSSQLIDADGSIATPWNRFFQIMYQKLGGTFSPLQGSTYIVNNETTGQLDVFDSLTGRLIRSI